MTTGMRQGELLGLQWGDVDLMEGALTVRRQLTEHADGSLELDEPKTARSRRLVTLPEIAVGALVEHRARLGVVPLSSRLVFTGARGKPLRKSNLLRRWFHPLVERARIPCPAAAC